MLSFKVSNTNEYCTDIICPLTEKKHLLQSSHVLQSCSQTMYDCSHVLGFYDFLELFFFQSKVIIWHKSLMALKSKKWQHKSEIILDFLQSRQGWKYTVKSLHTHPLIFDLMSLRKLHLNQMFSIDINKFLAQSWFQSLNTPLGRIGRVQLNWLISWLGSVF